MLKPCYFCSVFVGEVLSKVEQDNKKLYTVVVKKVLKVIYMWLSVIIFGTAVICITVITSHENYEVLYFVM